MTDAAAVSIHLAHTADWMLSAEGPMRWLGVFALTVLAPAAWGLVFEEVFHRIRRPRRKDRP